MKLGEVSKVQGGYAFKSQEFQSEGVPIIRIGNLDGKSVGIDYDVCYPREFWEEHPEFRIEKNSILIAMSGATVGKVGLFESEEKALLNQRVCILRPNENAVANEYLYFYCLSPTFKKQIEENAFGCAQPNISASQICNFEINVPTKDEQRKCVEQLQKLKRIISHRERELVEFDNLIKSRFVEMFGDPVSNPMGWDKVVIDDCVENIDNGKSFVCDSVARKGEEPAILKLSAATYGVYKPEENKAILDPNDFVKSAEVHVGDLLFTRKNTPELVGMAAYVSSTPKNLMMPDLIFRINTKQKCRKIYLWKLINHELFRGQIQSLAGGSAKSMSNISKERLGKLLICLPPLELQKQFEEFVHQIDKLKLEVQKSLDETQQLMDSLMQKYFG